MKVGAGAGGWARALACLRASSLETNPEDDPGFDVELFDEEEE